MGNDGRILIGCRPPGRRRRMAARHFGRPIRANTPDYIDLNITRTEAEQDNTATSNARLNIN